MKLVKIKSIEKIGSNSKLYDISVKDNTNFFANGVLVHNCSATYALYKNKFYVCSRNLHLPKKDNSNYWVIAEKLKIKDKLKLAKKKFGQEFVIQGEIVGPGVQGNKYGLKELDLYVYNVRTSDYTNYLSNIDIHHFCKELELYHVPHIGGRLFITDFMAVEYDIPTQSYVDKVDHIKLREFAKGKSLLNPAVDREGVVIRTFNSHEPERGMSNMFSFKVINPDFEVQDN